MPPGSESGRLAALDWCLRDRADPEPILLELGQDPGAGDEPRRLLRLAIAAGVADPARVVADECRYLRTKVSGVALRRTADVLFGRVPSFVPVRPEASARSFLEGTGAGPAAGCTRRR